MAATLQLRRGSSFTDPSISEPFFNTGSNVLQVGYGTTSGEHITLVKIGENTGDVSFIGDISGSNLSLSGNANIAGNITLGGSIYLGDGDSTDEIIVNASLSGSLVPDTDGVYDLGSTSFRYNNIHVLSASIENLQVGGSGILSSSQQISDYNIFLEIDGMNVVSGSSQIDLTQTTNYISGIKTRLNSETVISGSSQVTISDTTGYTSFSSSIATTDEGQDVRLDNIETFTASLDATFEEIASSTHTLVSGSSQIDVNTTQNFQSFSSSVDNRLDEVESTSSINETNITELFSTSSDHEGRVIDLESTGSNHETRITDLESFSSSLDNTFVTEIELASATGALETTDSELSGRLDSVENFTSSIDTTIKTKLNLDGVVSGSSQVIEILDSLNSYTSSNDINQGVQDDRLDNIELYTASLDNTYEEKSSLTHTLFSGSSQVNADTITNFDSNVKTKLDLDNVISSSVQVTISDTTGYTAFSASIATTDEGQNDRLDSIEVYTASVDNLYEEISSETHTLVSGSSQIQIDSVSGFTAHSSSVDSRLDSLEGDSHTHSNKAQLDTINQNLSKTSNVTFNDITASGNVIVSGDLTVLGTATEIQTSELVIKDKLITIASGSTNSAEADGSGIEIDGAGKSLIWDDATQSFILNAKVSSSVGFKGDGSELDNVTASDVEYINVLNKPTLFSGSSQVDYPSISNIPSGIVSGSSQVNADSIVNFDSNVKTKLDLDSVVSGSSGDQLTASLDSRYLEINGDGVFSGSSQVNADSIVNFDSNVKDKMNLDNVVSGSVQITNGSGILSSSNENFTTFSSSVDNRLGEIETTFSSSVDSRLDFIEGDFSQSVDSRLDLQEAFSESLDNEFLNTNGDNVVSGSTGEQLTASLDLRYEGIASLTNTLVSGSSQIDVTQTTNIETLATTGSNLFVGNQTITGSLSTSGSVSFEGIPWPSVGSESHIIKTQPYLLNLDSGNRSYDYLGIALEHFEDAPSTYHNSLAIYSFDNHDTPSFGTEFNVGPLRNHMRVYPSSSSEVLDPTHLGNISVEDAQDGNSRIKIYADNLQIGVFNSEAITIGNASSHIYLNANEIVSDSPISSSNHISASFFIGDGSQLENIVASEITYENITGLPNGLVSGSSQIDVTQTQNYGSIRQYDDSDNLIYLNSKNIVSGSTYSSPSQGTLRATINGVNSDVDLGLQSTDTPTFNSLTASNLPEHDNTHYDAVFKGTAGEFGYRTLATAAFYHVSNSIDDGNPLVLGNAGAVKTYVDAKIIAASAGDITEVNAGPGLGGGSTIGAATLNLDTGSQHFIDGVTGIAPTLPDGLISSSDQVTQSLDTRYVTQNGDNVISGSLFVEDIDDAQERVIFEVNNREATIFQVNNDIYSTTHGAEIIMNLSNGHGLFDGDIIISGDLTVNGTTTTINTTNLNVEDNIIELNYGGSATNGGILVKDVTGGSTTSGSLVWDGTNDVWKAGILGSESELLTTANFTSTLPAGIVSGSSQIDVTQTTNYSSINQYSDAKVKIKLDADNVHSGSYLGTATTSQLDEGTRLYYTNERVKIKLDAEGVISGSSQVLGGEGILSSSNENFTDFSSSVDSRFGALSTDYNDLQNVPSGIVSSSEQISNYTTFLEINGDGVISGSSQVQIDSVTGFTSFSSSVDGRIDLLESFSSSLDAGFVTEEELNTATQSLVDSIGTKLNTGSYNTDSQSFDSRLDSLEGVTSENPLTFTDTPTIDFTRVDDTITADVIGGIVSGSSQVISILDSLNSYTSSNDINQNTQDGRLDNLESYTASVDSLYEEKASGTHTLVSGSIQVIDILSSVNSYTSSNDINQNTQNGRLAALEIETGSIATEQSTQDGRLNNLESYTASVDSLYEEIASGTHTLVSGSDQLTGSLVDLTSAQTISGTKTFTDIVVNGTGSFATFVSTQTSIQYVGDSFIVLNNDTPTQRYAGLAVYDSGSAGVTASLQFDGQTNDWFYEYSDDGGVTTDHGAVLFGPEYSTKGSPTYPTNNTIQKGNGSHHLLDSNITDNGSTITLGSNTNVIGTISATTFAGMISGSSQIDYNSIQNTPSLYTSNQATNTDSDVTFNSVSATADIVAYASSDRRLKDNILPISNPLQKINSIGGYSFEWNVEKQDIYSGKDYGVIAQEIEEILPELVDTRENGYKAVKYDKLVSLLIEGIKELSTEVEQLKQQINK